MSLYTVRVTARRIGDTELTHRHYSTHAASAAAALESVKARKPYTLPFMPGVLFGHMPGSTFAVTGVC